MPNLTEFFRFNSKSISGVPYSLIESLSGRQIMWGGLSPHIKFIFLSKGTAVFAPVVKPRQLGLAQVYCIDLEGLRNTQLVGLGFID